jgi:hypothetical protein
MFIRTMGLRLKMHELGVGLGQQFLLHLPSPSQPSVASSREFDIVACVIHPRCIYGLGKSYRLFTIEDGSWQASNHVMTPCFRHDSRVNENRFTQGKVSSMLYIGIDISDYQCSPKKFVRRHMVVMPFLSYFCVTFLAQLLNVVSSSHLVLRHVNMYRYRLRFQIMIYDRDYFVKYCKVHETRKAGFLSMAAVLALDPHERLVSIFSLMLSFPIPLSGEPILAPSISPIHWN